MQRRMIKTKLYYKHFYSISKEASHIYLKVFPKCVYHWHNLLRWLFFVLCENWTQYFLFYLKRSVFKIYKKSFPSVSIIDTTCFDECFLFYVITGHSIFLKKNKFIVTQRLGATAILLRTLKQVFRKKSAFYDRYLHNNITMILIVIPKVLKFSQKFYLLIAFLLHYLIL